jgi:hypothetical protein
MEVFVEHLLDMDFCSLLYSQSNRISTYLFNRKFFIFRLKPQPVSRDRDVYLFINFFVFVSLVLRLALSVGLSAVYAYARLIPCTPDFVSNVFTAVDYALRLNCSHGRERVMKATY